MSDEAKLKELEERRAKARARLDAAVEARKHLWAADDLVKQIEDEERKASEEELFADLEREHGRDGVAIRRVMTQRNGMVVVKKPHHMRYSRFLDKGKHDRVSTEDLVKEHLLYPDTAKFNQVIEDEFDTLRKAANALTELHGLNLREEMPGK